MKIRQNVSLDKHLIEKFVKRNGSQRLSSFLNKALYKQVYDKSIAYRELVHHKAELYKRYKVLDETDVIKKEIAEFEKFAKEIMESCNNCENIKNRLKQLFKRQFGFYPGLKHINFYHMKNGKEKKK